MKLNELVALVDTIMASHYDAFIHAAFPVDNARMRDIDTTLLTEDLEYKITELKKIKAKLLELNENDTEQIEEFHIMVSQLR